MRKEKRISIINKAIQEVPFRWYEKIPCLTYLSLFAIAILSPTFQQLINRNFGETPLPLQITTATVFIISTLADRKSTIKGFEVGKLARSEGLISEDVKEENILLSGIKSSDEYKESKTAKALDIGLTALATAMPGFGLPAAALKVIAALGNFRAGYRLERALKIKSPHLKTA